MVECVEIVPRLMQALESPAVELTGEGFELALHKVFGHDVLNEELLVVNLPCPAVRLSEEAKRMRKVQDDFDERRRVKNCETISAHHPRDYLLSKTARKKGGSR